VKEIVPGVFRLQRSQGANGYLFETSSGVVVVDPGLPFTAGALIGELRSEGVLDKVTEILLTHYDMDHAGAAARLAGESNARVWIGADDAAVLRKQQGPGGGVVRSLMVLWGRPRLPEVTRLLEGSGPVVDEVSAMPTPGHTRGHYAFRWRDCVFTGDGFLVGKDGRLTQFPAFLVTDRAAARNSTELVASCGARWILPGHGRIAGPLPVADRPFPDTKE
jgi:glyoxylase-like metal-dependent hydrolase (beta-lactamase superfamily II)